MSGDGFDWSNRDDVVVAHQGQIAVYTNPHEDIVIRQEGDWWRKDDAWIVVRPENARALAEAILALAEPVTPPQLALPAPADRTAAERQRRYRERKRNAPCDRDSITPVTPCDRNGANLFPD